MAESSSPESPSVRVRTGGKLPPWRPTGSRRSPPWPPRRLRPMIDLRSDTVTLPTAAMRAAMAGAPLGDDQFGEDPSVNELQERVAALLGKEAGLFVPTGTMANQLPLKLYCSPGDDVVVGEESHAVWHEAGAAAANAGVQFTTAGAGGLFSADELRAVMKPRGHTCCSHPPRWSRSRTRTTAWAASSGSGRTSSPSPPPRASTERRATSTAPGCSTRPPRAARNLRPWRRSTSSR